MEEKELHSWKGDLEDYVGELVKIAADAAHWEKFDASEKKELLSAEDRLKRNFLEILKVFDEVPFRELREVGYSSLWNALHAAFVIGSSGTISTQASTYLANKQAALARKSRSENSYQVALRAAVEAEKTDLTGHHWKDAESIEAAVNRRLAGAGHKSTSARAIYEKLKMPPS
ncbi:hypothetical protein Msil_1548 [Methylocella silvestris BL2]|uniref:Uncharacterized protein n=1 Tax=Methylocella silvestris (strain DSM 15510 / CIP 108128 / LMG 27833 / NCIMB 13906 / BL2) TaxID=395965 RepID=B8EI16_METSB|nr:hypothetical protein [Methylocella silvestris]ACK50498.1 hypothetical protein Msil_1548 [Methylocella silvestris BL2]